MSHSVARGPRTWRVLRTGLVLACVCALTACSGLFSRNTFGDAADSSRGILIGSLHPKQSPQLALYYTQTVDWKPCHTTLECGTVLVPIDWQNVTSQSISLALVKHPAHGTSNGELLVNPGGPGGSGVLPWRRVASTASSTV